MSADCYKTTSLTMQKIIAGSIFFTLSNKLSIPHWSKPKTGREIKRRRKKRLFLFAKLSVLINSLRVTWRSAHFSCCYEKHIFSLHLRVWNAVHIIFESLFHCLMVILRNFFQNSFNVVFSPVEWKFCKIKMWCFVEIFILIWMFKERFVHELCLVGAV